MDNRRLFVAFFLSILVMLAWGAVFPPAAPVQTDPAIELSESSESPAVDPSTPANGEVSAAAAVSGVDPTENGDPGLEARGLEVPVRESIAATSEELVVVETEAVRAEFTNRGAQLLSWRLTEHRGSDGEILDLVRTRGTDLHPFALLEDGAPSPLESALYAVEQDLGADGLPRVAFRYAGDEGAASKVFDWRADGLVDVVVEVEDLDDWSLLLGPGIADLGSSGGRQMGVERAAGYRLRGETELLEADDAEADQLLTGDGLEWVSLEDNFFLVAAVPEDGVEGVTVRPVYERPMAEDGRPRFLPIDTASDEDDLVQEMLVLLEASDDRMELRGYFGPKSYRDLSELPYGLETSVRWGSMLGVLAKPLYLTLEWIHDSVVPNWGWAIVLVTILIKLAFFPLTHYSQKSMSRMQELNPKIQGIRAKYKPKMRDKQGKPNIDAQRQMNEEVMAVYKKAGVNPASGCLPMLLQMPVFFAFYRLLLTAVELRGAEWLLWIKDLSAPDPTFVLPLVMGAASLAMQKIMPAGGDPMQRKLMQLMPIMFTGFAIFMPSGLVLYWLTNNLLTMGQQAMINRSRHRRTADAAV